MPHQQCSDKPPPAENDKANSDNDESEKKSQRCSDDDANGGFIEIKDNKRRPVTYSFKYFLTFCERVATFLFEEFNQRKVCFGDQRPSRAHCAIVSRFQLGERHNRIAAGRTKRSINLRTIFSFNIVKKKKKSNSVLKHVPLMHNCTH